MKYVFLFIVCLGISVGACSQDSKPTYTENLDKAKQVEVMNLSELV